MHSLEYDDYDIDDKIYYHYCSINTFHEIIKNNEIWMGNPYNMNDFKEMDWFIDLVPKVVEEYIKELDDISMQEKYRYYYLHNLPLIYNEVVSSEMPPHIASFSEDGDVLSQWRAYADDGMGVAIGFDLKLLRALSSKNLREEPICYDKNEQNESVRFVLLNNKLDSIEDHNFNRMKDMYIQLTELVEDLMYQSIKYKNPAFKEEQEVRLILNSTLVDIDDKTILEGPLVRVVNNKITSYYKLKFESIKKDLIKRIFIGPKSKVTDSDINQMLKIYGYDSGITVEKSKASYR